MAPTAKNKILNRACVDVLLFDLLTSSEKLQKNFQQTRVPPYSTSRMFGWLCAEWRKLLIALILLKSADRGPPPLREISQQEDSAALRGLPALCPCGRVTHLTPCSCLNLKRRNRAALQIKLTTSLSQGGED